MRRLCLWVDIGAIPKSHPSLGNVFSSVPQPPATKMGEHTVHCAVISWLLKIGPCRKRCPSGPFITPWLPLLQVPKLWLLVVHVCGSFAFPSTSNDSCLTFYDFWLTSNDLLLTSKLRFILQCKSNCHSIFLKKQGIYSLYAKLWLVRPLIKNIPDSSHRYLSNVNFWVSLEFQMREEYVFEKIFFGKLYLKGGK